MKKRFSKVLSSTLLVAMLTTAIPGCGGQGDKPDDTTVSEKPKEMVELTVEVFDRVLKLTENDTKKEAVREAKRYIMNNWDGVEIKEEKVDEIVGCSAEGHVSHVYSERLSSRPKGWSKIGADQMAQLRIYKQNGGNIYDLVMRQKKREQKENETREHVFYSIFNRLCRGRHYRSS